MKNGALPLGYVSHFVTWERNRVASIENRKGAVALHNRGNSMTLEVAKEVQASRHVSQAAARPPRKCKTRFQKAVYSGPNAHRDAEAAERSRWLYPTQARRWSSSFLTAQPSNIELLGGGRRVGTVRNPVSVQKFIGFFSVTFDISYPSTVEHFTSYLKMRVSEPCTRCALKNTNRALGFLEVITGTPHHSRMTAQSTKSL